jgi:hypothetical protein
MSRSNSPGARFARAVEHHVLEEMRETGDARHFIAAADAHPVVERDVRDVAIRPDDDLQPIGESDRLNLLDARRDCGRFGLGGLGGGSAHGGHRDQQSAHTRGQRRISACNTSTGAHFIRDQKEKRRTRGKSCAAPKKRTPGKSCSQFLVRASR